jgi:hypothetical protein
MEPTQWQIFHFVVGIMVSLVMWWVVGLFRSWDLIGPLLIAVITGLSMDMLSDGCSGGYLTGSQIGSTDPERAKLLLILLHLSSTLAIWQIRKETQRFSRSDGVSLSR